MNALQYFDLFGVNFQFLLYGNKYHRSKFGGVLSIIYISLCTLVLSYYLYVMFNKNKFKINSYVTSVMKDEISELKTPTFILGLYIEPIENLNIIKYLNLKIINGNETFNSSDCSGLISKEMIEAEEEYNDYFDNSYCFNTNYSLIGSIETKLKTSLKIIYELNTSKLKEDLNSFNITFDSIKNKSISVDLLYSVALFDMKIDTDFKYIISNYSLSPLSLGKTCEEYILFNKLSFNIDKDIVKSNYETMNIYDFLSGDPKCGNSNTEIVKNQVNIFIDKQKVLFYIEYMKFQDMLNNVNSVTNALSLLFFLMGLSYNSEHLKDLIIKKSFIFKDFKVVNLDPIGENKKETFITSQIKKNYTLNNDNRINDKLYNDIVSISDNSRSLICSPVALKESKKYYKKLQNGVKNAVYVSAFPHFIKKFFEKILTKKSFNIFDIAEKKYEMIIDISNILLKFNQIDFLLSILFSPEQIKMFNFIKLTNDLEEEITYAEAMNYYNNRLKKKKIDKIDYLLLNSLPEEKIREFYPFFNYNNLELEQL